METPVRRLGPNGEMMSPRQMAVHEVGDENGKWEIGGVRWRS